MRHGPTRNMSYISRLRSFGGSNTIRTGSGTSAIGTKGRNYFALIDVERLCGHADYTGLDVKGGTSLCAFSGASSAMPITASLLPIFTSTTCNTSCFPVLALRSSSKARSRRSRASAPLRGMWWLFSEELPNVRYCGYCKQPYPACNQFFNWPCKRRCGPPPASCACGATGRLEVDHESETNLLRAWLCKRCNLRARTLWQRGPRSNSA